MRLSKIVAVLVMISLFLLPLISFALAADTSEYVGISENDVIIWDVEIDPGQFKDYYEDKYPTLPESVIDDGVDIIFDKEFGKNVEAWKFVVLDIEDEEKKEIDNDDYRGVKFYYNSYYTKDLEAEDWKKDEKNEAGWIFKFDKDIYEEFAPNPAFFGFLVQIVPKDMNWEYWINEADDVLDDDYDGEAGAKAPTQTVAFVIEQEVDGITTYYDEGADKNDDDVGEWESTSIYNDDGILKYYEWLYAGDPIIIAQLQENFFIANWWIIAIIGAAAVVVVIIIVVIKRR